MEGLTMPEMTWKQAIEVALKGVSEPLHYKEIAERIGQMKLRQNVGATPAATVGAQLYMNVKEPDSKFEQVGKGKFRLKNPPDFESLQVHDLVDVDEETGAIQAYGMFWRRDWVYWSSKPKLLGYQQLGSIPVDFAKQLGVYILYDRDRPVYVGRAADSIAERLKAHTINRLSGRWDRFSWFGLCGALEDGTGLTPAPQTWSHNVVIATLEAILIESLEPPLNRKGGDGFAATEYLQKEDPQIDNARRKRLLDEMAKKTGLLS
jgi:hypothetical protein